MINDRDHATNLIDEPEFNLSTPRFDERATANAQPVQPIPRDRVSAFHPFVTSIRLGITRRSRALVLVVMAGLVTGALLGMAWVNEPSLTVSSPPSQQAVSEVAPINSPNEEPRADVLGVTNFQNANPATVAIPRARLRVRSNRGNRAYRVAVLR